MKYISHLDLQRTFSRALQRGEVPVAYSRGFNPQPRLLFALPLALGIEGENEYLDLYLDVPWPENKLKETLNAQLPEGLKVKGVFAVNAKQPSLSSLIRAALFVVCLPTMPDNLLRAATALLQAETVPWERRGKRGSSKKIDLRPFIYRLEIKEQEGKGKILMLLAAGGQGGARPREILALLSLSEVEVRACRAALFVTGKEGLETPTGVAVERYLEVFYGKENCNQL